MVSIELVLSWWFEAESEAESDSLTESRAKSGGEAASSALGSLWFMVSRTLAASRSCTCWCFEMRSFEVYDHSGVCSHLKVKKESNPSQSSILSSGCFLRIINTTAHRFGFVWTWVGREAASFSESDEAAAEANKRSVGSMAASCNMDQKPRKKKKTLAKARRVEDEHVHGIPHNWHTRALQRAVSRMVTVAHGSIWITSKQRRDCVVSSFSFFFSFF